jgi:hypothetical protein
MGHRRQSGFDRGGQLTAALAESHSLTGQPGWRIGFGLAGNGEFAVASRLVFVDARLTGSTILIRFGRPETWSRSRRAPV